MRHISCLRFPVVFDCASSFSKLPPQKTPGYAALAHREQALCASIDIFRSLDTPRMICSISNAFMVEP